MATRKKPAKTVEVPAEDIEVLEEEVTPELETKPVTDLTIALEAPLVIQSNVDQLVKYVNEQLKPFENAKLVLDTPEQRKEMSDVYADLNKMKAAIKTKRITEINKLSAPINALQTEVMALEKRIDDAYRIGRDQLNDAEEAARDKKRAELTDEWVALVGDKLGALVTYDAVCENKWHNAGTSIAAAKKALADKAESVLADIKTLKDAELEFEGAALTTYYKTSSVQQALATNAERVNQRKEEEAAAQQAKEVSAAVAPEVSTRRESAKVSEAIPAPLTPTAEITEKVEQAKQEMFAIYFTATRELAVSFAKILKAQAGTSNVVVKKLEKSE